MSSVSSNRSFVHDEAGYEEVYPSGHNDHESQSEEKSPSASSPSLRDEDLEMDGPEDSRDGLDNTKPPIQSVVGPDGLRDFIIVPLWTMNYFTSTIKEPYFKALRAKYQIPYGISIRLPYQSEKCYYERVEGVRVYEQMLKARLRFPLSSLHRELLKHLSISVN